MTTVKELIYENLDLIAFNINEIKNNKSSKDEDDVVWIAKVKIHNNNIRAFSSEILDLINIVSED